MPKKTSSKKRTKSGDKCKGKVYWNAVAMAQGTKRKTAVSTQVDSCVRTCRVGRDVCESTVKSGLKGRRKARKSGVPYKRKVSRTKAAVAARSGFKTASKSCKKSSRTRKSFLSCMKKKAPTAIAAKM
jgi:hypothetical protein